MDDLIPPGGRIEDWLDVLLRVDSLVRAHVRREGLLGRFGDADIEAVRIDVLERIKRRAARVAEGKVEYRGPGIVSFLVRKSVAKQLRRTPEAGSRADEVLALAESPDAETELIRSERHEAEQQCLECTRRTLHSMLEAERTRGGAGSTKESAIRLLLQIAQDDADAATRPGLAPQSSALRKEIQRTRRSVRDGHCAEACAKRTGRAR